MSEQERYIIGKLESGASFSGSVTIPSDGTIVGTVSIPTSSKPYIGAYEADAMFIEQVFRTKSRSMTDDFTVHAINYTEAPNDWGTTVTIGG